MPWRRSCQASLAILKADVASLARSWVLRGWVIALVLAGFVLIATTMLGAAASRVPASAIVTTNLTGFLVIWSTLIIVLSGGSISHEAEIISDSILSRACTRVQFIIAKLASRALVILGVYLISATVVGYAAYRYAASDITVGTLSTAIAIVGLAVLLLVCLGVCFSVVTNNTVVSVVALLLLWYVASPVFVFVGADYLSPASLIRNLPALLKDPQAPQVVQCSATESSLSLVFSKRVARDSAEDPASYSVECPPGAVVQVQTATYDDSAATVLLGGLSLEPGQIAKVIAHNVRDRGGTPLSDAANYAECVVPGAPKKAVATETDTRQTDKTGPRLTRISATQSSVQVAFSEKLDKATAEATENYVIENPVGRRTSARVATYRSDTHTVLLSGLNLDLGVPVKVTVQGIKDPSGNTVGARGNAAIYTEVTPWKYVLGFGLPALASALLAVLWFNRRDF